MINVDRHVYGVRVTLGDFPDRARVKSLIDGCLLAAIDGPDSWVLGKEDFLHLRSCLDDPSFSTVFRDATDAALEVITEWLKPVTYPRVLRSKRVRSTLFPEQIDGVNFLINHRGCCLADEMGVGKTLQLLAAYAELREKEPGVLFVICPNVVKSNWAKEVSKHTDFTVGVVGNGVAEVTEDLSTFSVREGLDIVVIHYDALIGKKGQPYNPALDVLKKIPISAIVLDEAHQVKHLDTRRAVAVMNLKEILRDSQGLHPRTWLATGTLISESPEDAWSVFRLTDTRVPTYPRFSNHYIKKADIAYGPRTIRSKVGYKNLANLKAHLSPISIRRLKSDMQGFPDKVEHTISVKLGKAQAALYDDVRRNLITELNSTNDKLTLAEAAVKVVRLRQILNHPNLVDEPGESAKYNELEVLLEEILSDPLQKVIIWTEFRKAVELMSVRYAKYGVVQLMGGVKDIADLSARWDTSAERVAIGIPAFGGTGIDFLARCRTAIYVDIPFSTVLYRQSLDRIHRRVVTSPNPSSIELIKASPATVVYLHVDGTVDDLVADTIAHKGSIADALMTRDEKLIELGKAQLLSYLRR